MLFIPISYFKENIFSIDYKNFDSHQNLTKVLSKKVKLNKKEMSSFDYKYLIIKDNSNNYYTDLYAVRRLLWMSPLFFLFNLLLYLPIFNMQYFGTKNGSS